MTELDDLKRVVEKRRATVERVDRAVDDAVLRAYRAKRADGTPVFTLAEIGEALGVSRQRVFQLVRELAARPEPGTRTGTGEA